LLLPYFSSFDKMIDQIYRLTWYYPARESANIKIYYSTFIFDKKDLMTESNRPWYMHSLPINLNGLDIVKCNNDLRFRAITFLNLLMGHTIIVWDESRYKTLFYRILKAVGILSVVDHKISSYESDVNYVSLIHKNSDSHNFDKIRENSYQLFKEKVTYLRTKYKNVYIFGRGPSLGDATKFDFSDGVRIVCNQTVRDETLMKHIKPHFLTACDHALHYGCSKLADYFRNDLIKYVNKNNVLFLLPMDIYPLFVYHYPKLTEKVIGIPYKGTDYNFDLINDFRIKGSVGILQEILFPVAATIGQNVKMLGIDGKEPEDISDRVWTYASVADYPEEIVKSIHASRPGYYDNDMTDFEKLYEDELGEMIHKASKSRIHIETLVPSNHLPLQDKYYG